MAAKKKPDAQPEGVGAINVAARKIMVRWNSKMGSAVNYGDTDGKVISMSKSKVTVRPISESRPFDLSHVYFTTKDWQYITGAPWSTYHRLNDASRKALIALYKELFNEDPPKSSWSNVGDND